MKTAKEYRSMALETLRGNWKPYVLGTLVLFLPLIVFEVSMLAVAHMETNNALCVTLLMYALLFFCFFPFVYAYVNACLNKYRKAEGDLVPHVLDIFKSEYARGLRSYVRIFVLAFLYALVLCIPAAVVALFICKSVLGMPLSDLSQPDNLNTYMAITVGLSYIFLIPVYIWGYAVSQTPYIAHDRKDLSIPKCMKESKRLMKGHKWQLFCLQLSFLGWGLLCLLTLGIGVLWLTPYQYMAMSAFYEDVVSENASANAAPVENIPATSIPE